MLSSRAIANDSRVNRNVIANTRAGIPIHRGPSEVVLAMLSGYTMVGPKHARPKHACTQPAWPYHVLDRRGSSIRTLHWLCKGAFVRAAPIDHRNRDFQQSQVDRELTAV